MNLTLVPEKCFPEVLTLFAVVDLEKYTTNTLPEKKVHHGSFPFNQKIP